MTNIGNPVNETVRKWVNFVLSTLPVEGQPTEADLGKALRQAVIAAAAIGDDLDADALERQVRAMVIVWQPTSTGLSDDTDHIEWLSAAKADRDWPFWDRYERYLRQVRNLPPRVVWRLDEATDRILRRLEDPLRPGRWRRTGLVVGQVQSGKTGNYTGLACKAADAGFKLIVVLAGIHDSLRSQTQLRLDEGLIGLDTQRERRSDKGNAESRIGVGLLPVMTPKIASLTSSAEKGDFRRAVAANMSLPIGDYPVVLVVKKYKSILANLRRWIVEVEGVQTGDGQRKIVKGIPMLVIDDEADNASIDTSPTDSDSPSTINREIRDLLNSFEQAAYVGYTATPFANIYIDPDADDEDYRQDLFPDSFIENLSAPSNYLGPERVFGLRTDDPDENDVEPLPLLRKISDHEVWIPDGHRKGFVPSEPVPASLRTAVASFVLACATRRCRNQSTEHNSMLVHVTRFQDVQRHVREQVDDLVRLMRDRLRNTYGDEAATQLAEFKNVWVTDFVPATGKFTAADAERVPWEKVAAELLAVLQKIEVRAINGSSKDALEYYENMQNGLYVIAVGGDKLSRGLTLEGLTVSYYLRASNAYDTLLQMGRWFGYRLGYEDVCRLFTTGTLRNRYMEITAADNDLRRQFEEMSALGLTPRQFGLRVRASSVGLTITAPNKMRRGIKVQLSYSGDIPETVAFDLSKVDANYDNLVRFVKLLDDECATEPGRPRDTRPSMMWRHVPPELILDGFLDSYGADSQVHRVRPAFISQYIRGCMDASELGDWTVRLVSSSNAARSLTIGDHEVGLVTRSPLSADWATEGRYTIRRVLSPTDEGTDLDQEQWNRALAATKKAAEGAMNKKGEPRAEPTVPTGTPLRSVRGTDQALLLIYPIAIKDEPADRPPLVGFAISFPNSRDAKKTSFVVNAIWGKENLDDDDDELGDDQ